MTTTAGLPRQAPEGHHWVWLPTDEAEPGHDWTLLLPGGPRTPCRYGYRPAESGKPGHPACGAWSVARLTFDTPRGRQSADFCEEHLYRRRLIDGVLHTEVLEPIPGGEAA